MRDMQASSGEHEMQKKKKVRGVCVTSNSSRSFTENEPLLPNHKEHFAVRVTGGRRGV